MVDKLKKVINVPYEIIDQTAGIRPNTNDRRPFIGQHKEDNRLAVLNGLGTRGVMLAPTMARNLFNCIEKDIALDLEVDIKRFQ